MVIDNLKDAVKELNKIGGLESRSPDLYTKSTLILIGNILIKNKFSLGEDEYVRIYGLCDKIIGFWGNQSPAINAVTSQLKKDIENKISGNKKNDSDVINSYINLVNVFVERLIKMRIAALKIKKAA